MGEMRGMESDSGSDRGRLGEVGQTRGDGDRLGEMGLWGQIGGDKIMEADGGDERSRGTMGAGWGAVRGKYVQRHCTGEGVRSPRRSHSWTEGSGRPELPRRRGGGAAAGSTPALPAPKPRPRSPTPTPRSRPRRRAGVTVQPAGSGSSRAGPAGHAQCGGAAAAGGADPAVRTAAASLPRRRTCPRDLTTGAEVSARGRGRTRAARRGEEGRERDWPCSSPAPRRQVGAPAGGRGVRALLRAPLRPTDPGPTGQRFSGLRCAPFPEQALDGPAPPPLPGGAGPDRGWRGGGPGPAGAATPRAPLQPAAHPCAVGGGPGPQPRCSSPRGRHEL